jgi:hypothetical protein
MNCKCGAKTLEEHEKVVADGWAAHVYRVNRFVPARKTKPTDTKQAD